MPTKHLTVGSKAPPLVPGKLRVYTMRFCPFAQRIHLVLDTKKIPYDAVYINLANKPEWLVEKNPLSKVPLLELEDGTVIYESLIVAEYLDEAYPEHRLYPKDPLAKAKDKLFIEAFSPVIPIMYKVYAGATTAEVREHFDELLSRLEVVEQELVKRGTPYLGGKSIGIADLMIWPWIERTDLVKFLKGDQFVLPKDRFARLLEWSSAMKKNEAVQASYVDGENHAKYFRYKQAGTPQFDFLNQQ